MTAPPQYNAKLPSVKRILQEARELELEPSDQFRAAPLEDNLFEWHFTVRGPDDTAFAGGRYHGRLLMPAEYPFKPPTIMMLTPNGRFEVRKRICLSISDFHPEHWQPAWGVRTIMTALIGFFPSPADGAIGGLDYTAAERARLAARSMAWSCDGCGECMRASFAPPDAAAASAERCGPCGAAPAAAPPGAGSDRAEPSPASDAPGAVEPGRTAEAEEADAAPAGAPVGRAVHDTAPAPVAARAPAAGSASPVDSLLHNLALGLLAAIVALVLKKLLKL